ncbi:MAG TPA: 3'(2'),5'-bisphosphate nucleotidase CysQ [Nitrospiraceae bacterium]
MEQEIAVLTDAIQEAGARARQLAQEGFEVSTKADRSPVTTADVEVNRLLHERLSAHFPSDGWLSEESPDGPARLDKTRVWIVDPIDGTKAYINRMPEYCISVALVENGRPVVGAILNPSTSELFTASRGSGLHINGKPVDRVTSGAIPRVVMVTPWELRQGRWASFPETVHCRPMFSIAHALALVASDRAQATITLEPENEWDLAAGVLLIEESGGHITDGAAQAFRFNQLKPRFYGVIALAKSADRQLERLIRSHAKLSKQK